VDGADVSSSTKHPRDLPVGIRSPDHPADEGRRGTAALHITGAWTVVVAVVAVIG